MNRILEKGLDLPELVKGPVTHIDLVKYSGASGDFNPIHTVESFAVAAGLGGVIAHGMLTMAYLGQMITEFAGAKADLTDFSARFRSMVRPGDTVICKGAVSDVSANEHGQVVKLQIRAENQLGEVVVKGAASLFFPHESGMV